MKTCSYGLDRRPMFSRSFETDTEVRHSALTSNLDVCINMLQQSVFFETVYFRHKKCKTVHLRNDGKCAVLKSETQLRARRNALHVLPEYVAGWAIENLESHQQAGCMRLGKAHECLASQVAFAKLPGGDPIDAELYLFIGSRCSFLKTQGQLLDSELNCIEFRTHNVEAQEQVRLREQSGHCKQPASVVIIYGEDHTVTQILRSYE
ncbi:hypothetical protein M514_01013 [Trichuris suis]|uniref:Uncharacterized protein n=1 Tax=Trichuris suis TaxID=68888 RepID=A0A085NM19_9BILA|nr:hypothetical protein M513_01013 [Trichuris suis]KFD70515.1 hypothetical protein M514_01013 [Trichuris suis]